MSAEDAGRVYLVRSERTGAVVQVYAWENDDDAVNGAYLNDGFDVIRVEDPTDAERAEHDQPGDPVHKVLVVA